ADFREVDRRSAANKWLKPPFRPTLVCMESSPCQSGENRKEKYRLSISSSPGGLHEGHEGHAPGLEVITLDLEGRGIRSTDCSFRIIVGSRRTTPETFTEQRRAPATISKPLELEFVLVSSDYATMNAVSGGVKKYGAKFILVPTAAAGRDCLNRRRIDGVFMDLEVSGALGLIEGIRKGSSNNKAVIFACVTDA